MLIFFDMADKIPNSDDRLGWGDPVEIDAQARADLRSFFAEQASDGKDFYVQERWKVFFGELFLPNVIRGDAAKALRDLVEINVSSTDGGSERREARRRLFELLIHPPKQCERTRNTLTEIGTAIRSIDYVPDGDNPTYPEFDERINNLVTTAKEALVKKPVKCEMTMTADSDSIGCVRCNFCAIIDIVD